MATHYCLESPKGKLVESTFASTREDAWFLSFDYLCGKIPGFETKYWKRKRPSQAAARKLGWKLVPVVITRKA